MFFQECFINYLQINCKTPFGLWGYFISSTNNEGMNSKLESVQYSAALAISRAIKGASR